MTKDFTKEDPKDWTEDFKMENGNYINRCMVCSHAFMGHKHRRVCKECMNDDTEKYTK